jgi:hypothetical protein
MDDDVRYPFLNSRINRGGFMQKLPHGTIAPWHELTRQAQAAVMAELTERLNAAPNRASALLAAQALAAAPYLASDMLMDLRRRLDEE